jgi:alpha-L-arabinofuranosidase
VSNSGYRGIPVSAGEEYRFAVHARAGSGFKGGLRVRIEAEDGKLLAEGRIEKLTPQWQRHKLTLTSAGTTTKARLVVLTDAPGEVDLDMVSLFPKKTWRGRENGLRADLVGMLAAAKPGFIRFPGGCIVEGKTLANAYRWKETVGDIATRKQNWNRWEEVMANPNVKEYKQTCGLGFFEYFQLCEDIGAAPVPVLNCGMACQYQTSELVPDSELDPWIQDALDLIEFANGPVSSKWGELRAAMGHPGPFGMTLLGIGNEQWGPEYFERYLAFHKVLKARHPEITLITSSGPGVDDGHWSYAWNRFRTDVPGEIVDEHYYRPPEWFVENAARYDAYDRKGPKVFAGEFAAHPPARANNLQGAVSEAAFMTGLLRNADVVTMSCYAPLFAREGFQQWAPDLIWFDATRVMPTPSYHIQAMYGNNRPDRIVPSAFANNSANQPAAGRVGVGTWLTQAEYKDLVVSDGSKVLFRSGKGLEGWDRPSGEWSASEGIIRQNGNAEGAVALIGDPDWKDYTISLKARKTGGSEGFMILFHTTGSGVEKRCWWNLGGWQNSGHGLELNGKRLPVVSGSIELNRWYDIRAEVKGDSIRCFLDDKLIHDAKRPTRPLVHAVAGIGRQSGELILHAANPSPESREIFVMLKGWAGTKPATGQELTSASPDDRNTLDQPDQVSPKRVTVPVAGNTLHHTLPPWSHTVLRVPR